MRRALLFSLILAALAAASGYAGQVLRVQSPRSGPAPFRFYPVVYRGVLMGGSIDRRRFAAVASLLEVQVSDGVTDRYSIPSLVGENIPYRGWNDSFAPLGTLRGGAPLEAKTGSGARYHRIVFTGRAEIPALAIAAPWNPLPRPVRHCDDRLPSGLPPEAFDGPAQGMVGADIDGDGSEEYFLPYARFKSERRDAKSGGPRLVMEAGVKMFRRVKGQYRVFTLHTVETDETCTVLPVFPADADGDGKMEVFVEENSSGHRAVFLYSVHKDGSPVLRASVLTGTGD